MQITFAFVIPAENLLFMAAVPPAKGAPMKDKPGWSRWITWFAVYTFIDFAIARLWHGAFLRSDVNDALEGAMAAATMSWLISLYKWHKADSAL